MGGAKNILLGVTGGIAAYKSAELTRELVRLGKAVKVIMTKNAQQFVTPLTFQTLSGNSVYLEMFHVHGRGEIDHISLATWGEMVIVAPATANIIGKVAAGLADDLLSTTIMATKAPVLFVPAMNEAMWDNTILRRNIQMLKEVGYYFLDPDYGGLACMAQGRGRMPEVATIVEEMETILCTKDLQGMTILITAGPTREPLDPVRFITNHSSGKMGYALARMARRRGARVILISGPTELKPPGGVTYVPVVSAQEMREAVLSRLTDVDVVIKAAAVSDYRPRDFSAGKIKKEEYELHITLEKNPDILAEIGGIKGKRIVVGFAMETENLVENARDKLIKKNLDLIVANSLTEEGAGFQGDTNVVKIINRDGEIEGLPRMDKTAVADVILDRVKGLANKV